MKQSPSARLPYFESLRGLAALGVLLHHFVCTFWRGLFFEDQAGSFFERLWVNTPLNAITNGNLPVQFFFVLSGFLIARNIYTKPAARALSGLKRKYTNLLKLVVPGVLLPFLLMRLGLMYHQHALELDDSLSFVRGHNRFPPTFLSVPIDIIKTLFSGSSYNTPLWTIHFELIGGLLITAISSYIFHNISGFWSRKFAYLLFYIPLGFLNQNYCGFVIGALSFEMLQSVSDPGTFEAEKLRRLLSVPCKAVLMLIALYCATINMSAVGIWSVFHPLSRVAVQLRIFGIGLFLFVISLSAGLRKLLSGRLLVWLGKMSRYIFIFHWPIILSAGCFAYLRLYSCLPRAMLLLTVLSVCVIVTIAVSVLYELLERQITTAIKRRKRATS